MAKRKAKKVNLTTLLIVGEGIHDKAFINHMKDCYDERQNGQRVKVESSDGGSPRNILMSAHKAKEADYDRRFVLMDADVPITQQDHAYAKKHNITIIISNPICLEGMLLDVLGIKPGTNSDGCKVKIRPYLGGVLQLKQATRNRLVRMC
ncbi:hypothetical protein N9R79_07165 [Vibrio sp.]|nr:hypothetical protein [Vibrio sp.]